MSAYTEADVERLATVIHDARVGGIHYGNYTLARWILDRWLVEETGRRWVFSLDSRPDVVMADGTHRYWSTHCRHGDHDLCKGTCKGCGSTCICGCPHPPVEGSTPIASPPLAGLNVHVADVPDDTIIVGDFGEFARAAREGRSVNPKVFAAIKNVAAPAGEVASVPPPVDASLTARRLDFRFIRPGGEVIASWSVPNYMLVNDEFVPAVHPDGWMLWHGERIDPPWILQRHDDGGWTTLDGRASINEPAVAPPPVDALLKLLEDYGDRSYLLGAFEERFPDGDIDGPGGRRADVRKALDAAIGALWAAGVAEGHGLLDRAVVQEIEQRERAEEIADKLTAAIGRHLGEDFGEHSNLNDPWGRALVALAEADAGGKFAGGAYERGIFDEGIREGRRQRDAEIRADVLASARAVAAEAGFGPAPESVTVSYERRASAYEQGIYDAGVAEGRRQATDNRTEERATVLTEAYWKLRDHAAGLRDTTVYRKAAERLHEQGGRAGERYRSLETRARGIEDGARDLAELLGVEEHEIERGEVTHHG